MKSHLLILSLLLSTLSTIAQKPFKCTLKGTIIGRTSKFLYLRKATEDERGTKQKVFIHATKFEFTFSVKETEAYEMIFDDEYLNTGTSIIFFPIAGQVKFELYPYAQSYKNKITGGQLNGERHDYIMSTQAFNIRQNKITKKIDLLTGNKEYYSVVYDSLMAAIDSQKDHTKLDKSVWEKRDKLKKTGEAFTSKGNQLRKEQDALNLERRRWQYNYISNHISLFSYSLIISDLNNGAIQDDTTFLNIIRKVTPAFEKAYPTHSYTTIVENILTAFNRIKTGQYITDVALPDINGVKHNLSDVSKNKFALIDFWGSWCGPCIAATRTMLPIYNEFKNKGFTIVGIAKEYKNTSALKHRLSIEKYPWLNLVELDDKKGIWKKFGITNATGMMLLINKQGKILAIDPTAEQVKNAMIADL